MNRAAQVLRLEYKQSSARLRNRSPKSRCVYSRIDRIQSAIVVGWRRCGSNRISSGLPTNRPQRAATCPLSPMRTRSAGASRVVPLRFLKRCYCFRNVVPID